MTDEYYNNQKRQINKLMTYFKTYYELNQVRMQNKSMWLMLSFLLLASSFKMSINDLNRYGNPQSITADAIYYGDIITMDAFNSTPALVAIRNGLVIALGEESADFGKYIGQNTRIVNLHGNTLMPSFIDAHSHFGSTAVILSQGFNISPHPFGQADSIPKLLAILKNYIETHRIDEGEIICGGGYNDIDMIEVRHPTRYELDSVSTVNPILLIHFSGHIVVANSLALSIVNYINESSSPTGGIIDTFPNGTITGVCREHAIQALIQKFEKKLDNLSVYQIQAASYQYFSCGVTTAHDILLSEYDAKIYHKLNDSLDIDINGYLLQNAPDIDTLQRVVSSYNTSRFKTRGVKYILDGSIQGYTALLSQPYWVPQSMHSDDLSNYTYNSSRSCLSEKCGEDNFPNKTLLRQQIQLMIEKNIDILAHCNGDAAADHMINALEWARNNTRSVPDSRVIMVHSQNLRQDQLDRFQELGMNPSFFPSHIYYWGDEHVKIFLGPTRSNRMNPVGSTIKKGLKFTLHTDSPVVLAGTFHGSNTFLKLISSAVNRVTSSGKVLDDGTQKIPVYQALKALTINSAWQSHEEKIKGSIEVGKIADFIIINKNPLKIEESDLDSLQIVATIKSGKVVFGNYPMKQSNPSQKKQSMSEPL